MKSAGSRGGGEFYELKFKGQVSKSRMNVFWFSRKN